MKAGGEEGHIFCYHSNWSLLRMNKNIFLKKKKKPIYSRMCGYVAQKQLCKDVSGCSGKRKGCVKKMRLTLMLVGVTMHRKKATSVWTGQAREETT